MSKSKTKLKYVKVKGNKAQRCLKCKKVLKELGTPSKSGLCSHCGTILSNILSRRKKQYFKDTDNTSGSFDGSDSKSKANKK